MSVHPTSRIRSFATAGSIIASLAFTGAAAAADPTVTQVSGNPACATLDGSFTEVKVEPVRQGKTLFGNGSLSGTITVSGAYFHWSTTPGVDAVIVKGGPTANVYRLAGDEMTSGTGFHAPIDASSGRPYGLSHISFCTDGVDAQPPETSAPGPCEPGGPATMPDGKPCNPNPGPCEPGGPATMPDGEPCEAPPAGQTHAEPPAGEVLGTSVSGGQRIPAMAQMSAPSACVKGSYVQLVRGTGIRRVTMFVNGKRVRVFRKGRSKYALQVDPSRYPSGVMRLKARVDFVERSGRRPQTFRMTVLRCAKAAVEQAPAFAG